MRYLTLAAEYTQSALRDDFGGTLVPEEAGLSEDLGERIRDWSNRYKDVMPLDEDQRRASPASELIETLDEEGLRLVGAIRAELPDAKVRYFSEGRGRYVP